MDDRFVFLPMVSFTSRASEGKAGKTMLLAPDIRQELTRHFLFLFYFILIF